MCSQHNVRHTHTYTGLSRPIKIMQDSPYIVFLFVSGFLCLKVLVCLMLNGNIVTESSLVYLNGNLLSLYKCLWLYIRRRALCIPPVNIIRNLKVGPREARIIKEGLRGSCQYLFACLLHKPFLLHMLT